MKRTLLVLAATALLLPTVADGQVTTGTVFGVIHDETGGTLPGVTITITHVETGTARAVTTDDEGRYRAANLPPGTYEVEAKLDGFRTEARAGIGLSIGREAVVDFRLVIGQMVERLVVVGEAPLVETSNAITSALIDERQIQNLPLNGRDLTQLTLLTPGVLPARGAATRASNGFTTKISINGGRPQSNNFLLDGTDINANSNNTPGSVAGVQLGVDAVREFRVVTNAFSAEFGRAGAGVISSVTKSGTNRFSGSVFSYHRNDAFDARNFFDRAGKPQFTRNQFGGSLGGPIRSDRTFFFANYEGLRQDLPDTRTGNVPTEAARRGLLPGRTVQVSQAVVPYLNLYPLPNGRDLGDGRGEFFRTVTQTAGEDYFVGRIDHTFSQKDSLYGRYTLDDGRVDTPGTLGLSVHELRSRNQYLTLEEKRVLGSSGFNVVRFAFNRTHLSEIDNVVSEDLQRLRFVPEATLAAPGLGVTGLASFAAAGGSVPKIYTTNSFQFIEEFMYQRGRHALKTGFSFQRINFDQRSEINAGGSYSFQTLADFLTNNARSFGVQFPESDTFRKVRSSMIAAYVQDDIDLTPNLTLNLGLRWETITDPTEADGKVSVLRNILEPTATVADITTGGPLFHAPKRNFAPRVGLAWTPTRSGETVVRAGVGLFYDAITNAYYQLGFVRMPPFRTAASVDRTNQPIIFPDWRSMNLAAEARPDIESFPFELEEAPRYVRYSLNAQHQVTDTMVVSATYTGARGSHLLRHIGVNLTEFDVLPDGSRLYRIPEQRRNPNFASIRFKFADGTADYHGLALDLRKRWADDFQFQVGFTFAKSIDDGPSAAGNGDFAGDNMMGRELFSRERGRSPWDVRRSFVANAVYDLPIGSGKRWLGNSTGLGNVLLSGWQIGGIVQIADGSPFTAQLGYTPPGFLAGSGDQTYYPDLVPGASNNPVLGGPDQYFDPSSFAIPARGRVGNLGRNTIEGPGIATFDLSLAKNTRVGGERMVQVRVDAFNALNRTNFGLPQTSVFQLGQTAPRADAGRITGTATTARQMQLSVRLTF